MAGPPASDPTPDMVADPPASPSTATPPPIVSALPPELERFLDQGQRTLLVRGPPGVGKTTFVMALLQQASDRALVLTTRQGQKELSQQFPWLLDHPDAVVEGTSGMPAYSVRLEMMDLADQFALFPDGMKRLTSHLKERPGHQTIVVDSWDALIDQMRVQKAEFHRQWDTQDMETLLLQTLQKLDRNLVLVLEHQQPTRLDYLCDGIAVLDYADLAQRKVRLLHWEKLRGVRVSQHHYPYTLRQSAFTSFAHRPHRRLRKPLIGSWIQGSAPDPQTGSIPSDPEAQLGESSAEPWEGEVLTTGCSDLDRLLGGGLPPGTHALLELGEHVPADSALWFLSGPTVGTLHGGGGAFLLPSSGYHPRRLIELLDGVVSDAQLSHLKLGVYAQHSGAQLPQEVLLGGDNIETDFEEVWKSVFALVHGTGGRVMTSLAYDTIEYLYGRDTGLKVLGASVAYLRDLQGVGVDTVRPSVAMAQQLRDIADVHLRLEQLHGVTLLLGIKPRFRWHVVRVDQQAQKARIDLIPLE